jgi:hypothetical protein
MGVAMCGDRFNDDADRHALLDVLAKCEKIHLWPTNSAQDRLKVAWGWPLSD